MMELKQFIFSRIQGIFRWMTPYGSKLQSEIIQRYSHILKMTFLEQWPIMI